MSRVFTAEQAANLIWRSQFQDALLAPRRLSDGRYALPESVVDDRRFALYRHLLTQGTVEADAGLTFVAADADFRIDQGGQPMYLSAGNVGHAFGIPAPNVYRFELRQDESGYGGDPANGNRRAELVSAGERYSAGQTIWESWSMVIGTQRAGFGTPDNLGIVHQWHSVDTTTSRSPIFGIGLTGGMLNVYTRSDLHGATRDDHYTTPAPASGVVLNFVVAGKLGASGHLNVWINGIQVVNVDTPIGYYNDDAGARALAYPHWGMYMRNAPTVNVLFHANVEWGTSDLSARIATPLAVTTPPDGWV